jgi:hypothetical protein
MSTIPVSSTPPAAAPGAAPAPTLWDTAALARFSQPGCDILLLPWDRPPGCAEQLAGARVESVHTQLTAANALARVTAALGELGIDSLAVAADMAELARAFLAQFGQAQCNARVELVNQRMCPKFHCDHLHVRLIATYHGPTTEYVRTEDPQTVQTAPPGTLVLLKGRRHPTFSDSVHHRSPDVPAGQRRLCLVLDY